MEKSNYKNVYASAEKWGIGKESARQAVKDGKSLEVLLALIFAYFSLAPKDLVKYVPRIRKMFSKPGQLSLENSLIEEAKSSVGNNEFIAELRTIIARFTIRKELGLVKKPGRPRKKD